MSNYQNFLYRNPTIYDRAFPDRSSSKFFLRALEKYAPHPVRSVLDLGCGTGNTLEVMARTIPECTGLDMSPSMIEYGKKVRPNLDLRMGDMRTACLDKKFDGIGCFGWAFSYNLKDQDIISSLETFRFHAHPGTVLAFDCGHAVPYFQQGDLKPTVTEVATPDFHGRATATFQLDREGCLLKRKRHWEIPGHEPVEDYCEYRLHFPAELEKKIEGAGFEVLELAGDPAGTELAPGEKTLYCAAVKK